MNLIKNLNLHLTITLPLTCAALWLSACSGDSEAAQTEEPSNADGGDIDITPDAGGSPSIPDAGPIKEGCQRSKLPSEDTCVLHETLGVFVSASKGADTNEGSRARPFASIAKGIATAKLDGRRVYVCAEEYVAPTLELQDGVSVFANLTCTAVEWGVSPAPAVFKAATAVGARAVGIRAETRIEGLAIVAAAGTIPGESSIGLIANDAGGLRFVSSRIVAQGAADGSDGADGIQLAGDFPGQNGVGNSSCTFNPTGVVRYSCPDSTTSLGGAGVCTGGGLSIATNPGGLGGKSAPHELTGNVYVRTDGRTCLGGTCYATNGRGMVEVETSATAVGADATYISNSTSTTPTARTPAQPGRPGAGGADGTNPPPLGSLTIEGYVPTNGAPGQNGSPGQGGGGGSAASPGAPGVLRIPYLAGPSGGGGGAGGCPGVAGGAGRGGGASIAVLVQGAAIRIDASRIEAGNGGLGGRGSLGSAPTAGSAGGTGGLDVAAPGGIGGAAGWSGHGSSGPSFGIAWTGTLPLVSADTAVTVAPPRPGQAAMSAYGKTLPAMAAGASEAIHAF